MIQTSNEEPFLRAADAATAKKQAATSMCVTKMTSLGVTAPERTASAEVQQLASRQAMVRIQDGACVSAHKHLCHATLHLHIWGSSKADLMSAAVLSQLSTAYDAVVGSFRRAASDTSHTSSGGPEKKQKQVDDSICVTKIASLGVTAPERTASAEIKQLASRQAMVCRQTSLPCNPSHPQEFER